jgi:hypothetical protein
MGVGGGLAYSITEPMRLIADCFVSANYRLFRVTRSMIELINCCMSMPSWLWMSFSDGRACPWGGPPNFAHGPKTEADMKFVIEVAIRTHTYPFLFIERVSILSIHIYSKSKLWRFR